MASRKYEDRHGHQPDVRVHHRGGCSMDGRKDEHVHRQADHREYVDRVTNAKRS